MQTELFRIEAQAQAPNHRYDPDHAKHLRVASNQLLAALRREHPCIIRHLTRQPTTHTGKTN